MNKALKKFIGVIQICYLALFADGFFIILLKKRNNGITLRFSSYKIAKDIHDKWASTILDNHNSPTKNVISINDTSSATGNLKLEKYYETP